MDLLRECQPQTTVVGPWTTSDSVTEARYPSQKSYALYLVGYEGILYHELMKSRQTVNAERYGQQLGRLSEAIEGKRPIQGHGRRKIILLHDNARPPVAISTQQTITDLGWEVSPYPAYSPDLAPSDYYLFRSMEHFLREKKFKNEEDLRNQLDLYFSSNSAAFYRDGIRQLSDKWEKVIANHGNYFSD
jgi:hypothetical protein